MSNPDGGPAFPRPFSMNESTLNTIWEQDGMALRDWFAGQALAFSDSLFSIVRPMAAGTTTEEFIATMAYAIADAMLSERAKVKP